MVEQHIFVDACLVVSEGGNLHQHQPSHNRNRSLIIPLSEKIFLDEPAYCALAQVR